MSFEVTYEPFEDEYVNALPQDLYDETVAVIQQENRDPVMDLPKVKSLIERGAQVPKLYNYLFAGYKLSKRLEEARATVEETCRLFPDYFFGKIENARVHLEEGDLDGVLDALGGTYSLPRLCGTDKIHFSEFRAWCMFMCEYQLARKCLEGAVAYRDILASADAEDSAIDYMNHQIERSRLVEVLELFEKSVTRKKSVRKKKTNKEPG